MTRAKRKPRGKSSAKKSYSERLRDGRWQKKRLECLEASEWQCSWCGARADAGNQMQVHHGYYGKDNKGNRRDPWEYPADTLHCLCDSCHEKAETARAAVYYELGKIHPRYHWDVRRLLLQVLKQIAVDPDELKNQEILEE